MSFAAALMFLSFSTSSDLGFWLCWICLLAHNGHSIQLGQILIEMQIVKVPCGLQTGLPVIDPATNPEAGIQIWLRCARTKHSLN